MADSSKGILGELGEVPEHDFASLVSMIQMLSAELKLALGRQERALVELDTVEARAAEIFVNSKANTMLRGVRARIQRSCAGQWRISCSPSTRR